jgi:regulator of protease activity HflC (stomatin/prohibitin superfamily)/DNA-directed RNA polymerase subunit RPC12/RpoP
MAQDYVEFQCECGQSFKATIDQGGEEHSCPGCGRKVQVPRVNRVYRGEPPRPHPKAAPAGREGQTSPPRSTPRRESLEVDQEAELAVFGFKIPTSIPGLLRWLVTAWFATVLALLLLGVFSTPILVFSLLAISVLTFVAAREAFGLLRARERVLQAGEVPLLWGMVKIVAWEPTEGVLVLRDKKISFKDDTLHDNSGGIRLLFPILGEELALRVPLETQSLHFSDDDVLTREYLTLTIRGTMKWRIIDIRQFYLLVSRELRYANDKREGMATPSPRPAARMDGLAQASTVEQLKTAAIEWLRWMAEEQTRAVVSRISSGLLIAEQLAGEMPEIRGGAIQTLTADSEFGTATQGLAARIMNSLAEKVRDYGIHVHDVSLQEIKLPAEIHKQCVEACKAAYLPMLAQRQAAKRRVELETEVSLLGKEAVGAKEIVGVAPAFTLPDLLNKVVAQQVAAHLAVNAVAPVQPNAAMPVPVVVPPAAPPA